MSPGMSPEQPRLRHPAALRRSAFIGILAVTCLALVYACYRRESEPRFLTATAAEFVELFPPPPAANSVQTRSELDVLLAMQARRTPAAVEAARADRKTEISRFASALTIDPRRLRALPALDALADQVEDDERRYVRAAKNHFVRLRPYEVDARIEPCITDVRGDLSYPSGHATYGFLVAYLLSDMVPERRAALMARAQEFARQRMLCGVHFPSDIAAGQKAAEWLAQRFLASATYRAAAAPAARELRAAILSSAAKPAR
jgi:acid phosphatase (class A)